MKALFYVDSKHKLVVMKFIGEMNVSDSAIAFQEIKTNEAFSSGFDLFVDMTELTQANIDYNRILQSRPQVHRQFTLFAGQRIAGYFNNPKEYGIGRQWQSMLDDGDYEVKSFMNPSEAFEWLELPPDFTYHFDE